MPDQVQTAENLSPLLDLQEVDTATDRLVDKRTRLAERAECKELEGRIREVEAVLAGVKEEITRTTMEEHNLENELGTIEAKVNREETRMYSGQVVSPKELSAIQAELEMFGRQKAPIEQAALELLVRRDELNEQSAGYEREVAALNEEVQTLQARITDLEAHIDRQITTETAKRQALVPRIAPDVLEQYNEIRQNRKGVGVGALRGGICSACREALSSMELDRIRRQARATGEHLFRCEHCRRLLVLQT